MTEEEILAWSRPVKTAGCKPLKVVSLHSLCGNIDHGVAFEFEGDGAAFVVDLADLRAIVEEATAVQERN